MLRGVEPRQDNPAIFALGMRDDFELDHRRGRRRGGFACGGRAGDPTATSAGLTDGNLELADDDGPHIGRCVGGASQDSRRLRLRLSVLTFCQFFDSSCPNGGKDVGEQIFRQAIECGTKAFHQSGA